MFKKNMGWILSAVLVSSQAQAQYYGGGIGAQASLYGGAQGQWGAGHYGAMQPCLVKPGAGAISQSDEMSDIKDRQKELREELNEKKRTLRGLSTKTRRSEAALRTYLKDDAVSDIRVHVTSGRQCNEWTGRDGVKATGPGTETNIPKEAIAKRAGSLSGKTTVDNREAPEKLIAFTFAQWKRACSEDTGTRELNNYEVCHSPDGIVVTSPLLLSTQDEESCINNLSEYQKSILDRDRLTKDIARLEAEDKALKDQYRIASREFKKDLKDGVYDDYDPSDTEGVVCHECERVRKAEDKNRWAGVASNVGMGLLGIYLGGRQTRTIADHNSSIGAPTENNYYPYVMAAGHFGGALYGALGGGTGEGAYRCGSTIGGGGNPYGGQYGIAGPYMGGQGGGQFNPFGGMGSAGGQFNPFFNGGFGGQVAPGAGFNPFLAGGGGGFGGPGFGGQGQFNPFFGGGGGFGGPGFGGQGQFNPFFGGGGGFGGPSFGGQGQFNPFFGGGGGFGGPGFGGQGQFNPFGNQGFNPYGGGGFNSLGQLQMQQQMLQQQFQQAQMQFQQQQMYIQNETRRQQTLGSLNMELQSLMTRIQQVQYGGSFGTSYPGLGGSGGFGGQVGFGGSIGIGGSIGVGGQYGSGVGYGGGNGSYLYPPYQQSGNTNCVGVSCAPSSLPGGTTSGPTR